jgi:predicted AAA+ superfamily ATPase
MLFKGIYRHEAVSLEDVLNNHASLEMEITSAIKPLMHFGDYLREGYYPFVLEAKQDYLRRLEQLMLLIIYQDIPHVEDISLATLQKAQKLLMILATQVPLEPNISILCREIGATRDIVIKLLHLMEKSGLLMLVNKESNSYKTLSRPDKIYLNNTNQMYALTHMVNEGTLRETFFVNQLRQAHSVLLPVKGDYLVDEHYTFEVGGASKSFDQIKNIPDSYLALDEMEYGSGNAIPLYLFGFLY